MKESLKKVTNFFKEKKVPFSWYRIWLIVILTLVIAGLFLVGFIAYAKTYSQKVLPGVHIGDIPIGGLNSSELKTVIQSITDKLITEGITFSFGEESDEIADLLVYPIFVTDSNSLELVEIDIDEEVKSLLSYKKEGNVIIQGISAVSTRISQPSLKLQNIAADKKRVIESIEDYISNYQLEPVDASVQIKNLDPLEYSITSSSPGLQFDYEGVVGHIVVAWSSLEPPKIHIKKITTEPVVLIEDVEKVAPRLDRIFKNDGLTLNYNNPHTQVNRSWKITKNQIKDWLNIQKTDDNKVTFGLDASSTIAYLEDKVKPVVNIKSVDAKFRVNNSGRVIEFQGSRPGIALDIDKTYAEMNYAIRERIEHDEGVVTSLSVAFNKTEPQRKTGDVNELGIADVLGVGISDFSGSPKNRIKNITNAINKLNGVIIKPGEEFSAIDYTQPYTIEGGYLPELVIKGDEIKPEIGGGLCQIGTTLFRVAMNSGMEITQRRNHSLVVNYYNDARNNLPGTDATIYDPNPDFKFKNDTKNNILLQADIDLNKSELIFTLWGASDGREASYTEPVVHNWIKPGPTKIIETTKIPVGTRNCQHAYTGANTSFTYTRKLPNGETEDVLFESHYRPLPEICLVGIEKEEIESEIESEIENSEVPNIEETPVVIE